MKSTILIVILLCGVIAYAKSDELPQKVNEGFKKKFPNTSIISWYEEENIFKVEFEFASDYMTASFSIAGLWLETSKAIENSEIPKTVESSIQKKYAGSEVTYAEFVENNLGLKFFKVYGVTSDANYIIDISQDGKILKEVLSKFDTDEYDDE